MVTKSESEYASPLEVVKKIDANISICLDYRKLNAKIIRGAYPISRIDDSLEAIAGSTNISVFYLKSAYDQMMIMPEDHHKTVFSLL